MFKIVFSIFIYWALNSFVVRFYTFVSTIFKGNVDFISLLQNDSKYYLVRTNNYNMQKSHVLINCENGSEETVSTEIVKMPDVKYVARTSGYYDLVVELEAKSEEELKKIIGTRIKNIKSIRSSVMLMHV